MRPDRRAHPLGPARQRGTVITAPAEERRVIADRAMIERRFVPRGVQRDQCIGHALVETIVGRMKGNHLVLGANFPHQFAAPVGGEVLPQNLRRTVAQHHQIAVQFFARQDDPDQLDRRCRTGMFRQGQRRIFLIQRRRRVGRQLRPEIGADQKLGGAGRIGDAPHAIRNRRLIAVAIRQREVAVFRFRLVEPSDEAGDAAQRGAENHPAVGGDLVMNQKTVMILQGIDFDMNPRIREIGRKAGKVVAQIPVMPGGHDIAGLMKPARIEIVRAHFGEPRRQRKTALQNAVFGLIAPGVLQEVALCAHENRRVTGKGEETSDGSIAGVTAVKHPVEPFAGAETPQRVARNLVTGEFRHDRPPSPAAAGKI
ncbi:hypothetical protein SDC9_137180 [bioreactor metagenome]|uniref:Uncharacterized protein n=1 Tax=bioreactor metagenome TaxID=1076179 RepID=A0A645DKU4_9ZZZZ